MSDSCCQHHAPEPGANPAKPDAFGVENPRSLDALALDGETGEAVLIMVEPRLWDGSEDRLFQLQEKINAYLSFALDGEMTEAFPHLAGKPIRLQLDCATPPDVMTEQFIARVREQIGFQEMKFAVRVVGEPAPEGGCCDVGSGCCKAENAH
ncbi:MAG: DUF6572 domain-containing protein [Chthoniobacteraceae bacterium]